MVISCLLSSTQVVIVLCGNVRVELLLTWALSSSLHTRDPKAKLTSVFKFVIFLEKTNKKNQKKTPPFTEKQGPSSLVWL